jgi:hypothetical protein
MLHGGDAAGIILAAGSWQLAAAAATGGSWELGGGGTWW